MFTATDVTIFESISCDAMLKFDEFRAEYSVVSKHKYFSERHWNLVFGFGKSEEKATHSNCVLRKKFVF